MVGHFAEHDVERPIDLFVVITGLAFNFVGYCVRATDPTSNATIRSGATRNGGCDSFMPWMLFIHAVNGFHLLWPSVT